MATNIDKALNRAPLGLSSLTPQLDADNDLDIEIELAPEDGDPVAEEEVIDPEFTENLADNLDEKQLTQLASDLIGDFEDDLGSRRDWIQTYVDGLELLGMKIEDRTEPWPGACGVYHPIMSEALVKFQAETMMETFPARGPVRTEIIGEETSKKKEAAVRVEEDMNYQLTDRMQEYRPEHERMLWGLGLSGNAFKKVYFDPALDRQVAMYVPAEDVVIPYGASSLETAERVTHVMRKTPNELKKLQVAGFYRDVVLGDPTDTFDDIEKKIAEQQGFRATADDRYKLLEMQVFLDLPGYPDEDDDGQPTGIALPYIVTVEKSTAEILSIRRNWHPEDVRKEKRNHFVHYSYIPGFGFYAFGLIHLIGAFAKSGTSIIRQLVDAGTLSNLPGGFKTKGLRVKGDDNPIGPGEFRDVDVASGTMRDNIMPLPYKEPSLVLFQLLQNIVDEGRRFASAADLKVSDMSAQSPVGTTLAILERTLKVMSAVQARIFYAMKREFQLLRDIIRDYTPDEYTYEPTGDNRKAKKADYDLVSVIPVSDPNSATMSQKVVQYQAVMQLAEKFPQLYDLPYLNRQMLEVLGVKNPDKLVPLKDGDDMKQRDPVSENMDVINGKPVKAFIAQDHEAHITVHTSAMQDPQIMQLMGQNPQAPMMMAAMQAHICEHIAFEYRRRIEEQAGVPYPAPDAEMTEQIEVEISRLAAAAAKQVLQTSQQKAAQQQAQQMAQDPIVHMQMKELELKEKDVGIKEKKLMIDAVAQADKIGVDEERIRSAERIAGLQVGAKLATDKENRSAQQQAEGLRIGVDVARELSSRENQTQQSEAQRAHDREKSEYDRAHKHDMQDQQTAHQMGLAAQQQAAPQPKPADKGKGDK